MVYLPSVDFPLGPCTGEWRSGDVELEVLGARFVACGGAFASLKTASFVALRQSRIPQVDHHAQLIEYLFSP